MEFIWCARARNPVSYLPQTVQINGHLADMLSGALRNLGCLVHRAKKSATMFSDLQVYSLVEVAGDVTSRVRNSSVGKEHAMQT